MSISLFSCQSCHASFKKFTHEISDRVTKLATAVQEAAQPLLKVAADTARYLSQYHLPKLIICDALWGGLYFGGMYAISEVWDWCILGDAFLGTTIKGAITGAILAAAGGLAYYEVPKVRRA